MRWLWDTISYNNGKGSSDGNNYWKSLTVPHYVYIGLMLTLMGVGIGLMSLFVCAVYLNNLGLEMFLSYFHEPLILVLNVVPCVLLVLLCYFIFGRAWAAFSVSGAIVFVMSIVNYYKIRLRTEPFVAADLVLVDEAAGIISNYTLEITGRVISLVVAFIFGVLFAVFLMKGKLRNKWVRIIGAVLVVAVMAALFIFVYTDDAVYSKATNNTAVYDRWTELEVYVSKGFLYPFINSIPDAMPKVPEGYSAASAAADLASYGDTPIPEDKKVNIISVMLESYADLSKFPGTGINQEVYAPLYRLREESISGNIISNTFGGGTIDSERSFLTGYAHQEAYRATTSSHIHWLKQNGYAAEGMHPGLEWFYNRQNVMTYLGMEEYYFLADYPDGNRTDEFFFPALYDMYLGRDTSKPYFNFSVTFQNHGAYDSESTVPESYLEKGNLSDEAYNILNNYLSGIADTSRRLEEFVDLFRDDPEPVVLLLYGDHMPWLGDGSFVYKELGIEISVGSEGGFYNYYSTPYLIWANDAAKELTGGDFTGDGGDISPCYLMNLIADECSWEGSAWLKMTDEAMTVAPVISSTTGMYQIDGALTDVPTGEAAELIKRLGYAEYYMKHNFVYG